MDSSWKNSWHTLFCCCCCCLFVCLFLLLFVCLFLCVFLFFCLFVVVFFLFFFFLFFFFVFFCFILSELSPFLELYPFGKIRMKSDVCHILRTVHARVLKVHARIPHRKNWPVFFSCPSYLPSWSYAPLKKSEWNLVIKMSWKVFKLETWNLVSW